MFYAHIILAQKGPLARVWLAAHWDKKITKAHVFETNIEKSVEGIMQPKVKLALRTSGHLLLGVVRIYSRKAKYLLADCNEAFVKIKMAFRPGMVDLPEGHREANVNAITLPEVFHDFDTALPELNDIDIEAQFTINQSRADEITMREDYGSLSLSLHDEGFGDIGFDADTPNLIRGNIDSEMSGLFEDQIISNDNEICDSITKFSVDVSNTPLEGDGFGDEFGQPQLFEDDLFGEPALGTNADKAQTLELPLVESDEEGIDQYDANVPSPTSSCKNSHSIHDIDDEGKKTDADETLTNENIEKNMLDQSTLLQNEDESFALAPIDASAYIGITKTKRKRKLIVDEIKNISGEEMKAQLADTSDIVTTLDLAPPTKRLMYWKETGGVEKLFSLPSRTIPARALFVNYSRHLLTHFTSLEDFSCLGPCDLLALESAQNEIEPFIIQSKRGRKRKLETMPLLQQNLNEDLENNTFNNMDAPEPVRDDLQQKSESHVSLGIDKSDQDSLVPAADATAFESIRTSAPDLSTNDFNRLNNLPSLNEASYTPGIIQNAIDHGDDFNQGDITPAGLHHGQLTPHHSGIDSIEFIPNIPSDQLTSILDESEHLIANAKTFKDQSRDIASEWNDYDLADSIAIQNVASDEQMENETTEQFEERVLNRRAAQLFFTVKARLVKQDCILLSDLTMRNSRKQAAQKFYSLLVLKKFRALNISQSTPYSNIFIARGPLFDNPNL